LARLRKLNDALRDEVANKSAEGISSTAIAAWLLDVHDIKISRTQVSNYLREVKAERKEIAQRLYAASAAENANEDLHIIGEIINKFHGKVVKSLKADELLVANKLADTLLKYISKRIDLSGLNMDDDAKVKQVNDIRDEWLKRLK